MADKGIIFSAPMVQALLAGRKTQTRRLLNPQPRVFEIDDRGTPCQVGCMQVDGEAVNRLWLGSANAGVLTTQKIHFALGDRLYVREAWSHTGAGVWTIADARRGPTGKPIYRATDTGPAPERWWPSIHMPREFSRLTLTVTDVRVQRLREISEGDAKAEGISRFNPYSLDTWRWAPDSPFASWPEGAYRMLWDSLHTKPGKTWADNPWVVAVSFDVRIGNIDA